MTYVNSFGNGGYTLDQYLSAIGGDLKDAIGAFFGGTYNPRWTALSVARAVWVAKQQSSTRTASPYSGNLNRSLSGFGSIETAVEGAVQSGFDPYYDAPYPSLTSVKTELNYYRQKYGALPSGQVSPVDAYGIGGNPFGLKSEDSHATSLSGGGMTFIAQYDPFAHSGFIYPPWNLPLSKAAALYLWNVPVVFSFLDAVRFYSFSTGAVGPVTGNVGVKITDSQACAYRLAAELFQIYSEAGSSLGVEIVRSSQECPGAGGMSYAGLKLSPYMLVSIGNGTLGTASELPVLSMPNVAGSGGGGATAGFGVNAFMPFNSNNRALPQSGCQVESWQKALGDFVLVAAAVVAAAYALPAIGVSSTASGAAASGAATTGTLSTGTSSIIAANSAVVNASVAAETEASVTTLQTLGSAQLATLTTALTSGTMTTIATTAQNVLSQLVTSGALSPSSIASSTVGSLLQTLATNGSGALGAAKSLLPLASLALKPSVGTASALKGSISTPLAGQSPMGMILLIGAGLLAVIGLS